MMAYSTDVITELRGEDAQAVLTQIEDAKYDRRKERFLKRCDATYERLVRNAQTHRTQRA